MIENGYITHGSTEPAIFTLQYTHSTIYEFLIAALTMFLSFQTGTVVLDLVLGLKKAGECRIADLAVLHLSDHASPLAMLSNIFPVSVWSRLRYRYLQELQTQATQQHRERCCIIDQPVSKCAIFKLGIIILFCTLANVFSIILAIEIDLPITFGQAQFGGVSLGVPSNNTKIRRERFSKECFQYKSKFGVGEYSVPEFFTCGLNVIPEGIENEEVEMVIRAEDSGTFRVELNTRTHSNHGIVTASMRLNHTMYRLGHNLQKRELASLLRSGLEYVRNNCIVSSAVERRGVNREEFKYLERSQAVSQKLNCRLLSHIDIMLFQVHIMDQVQIVGSESFTITPNIDGNTFSDVTDLIMLQRRRPLVDIVTFVSILLAVVLVSLILKVIVWNDVHVAKELLVRLELGVDHKHQLLYDFTSVTYNFPSFHMTTHTRKTRTVIETGN